MQSSEKPNLVLEFSQFKLGFLFLAVILDQSSDINKCR